MANHDFCSVRDFPMLVPYQDVEKLVEVAKNMERYERTVARMNEQLGALRRQYSELLEKIRDMEKQL